MSCVALFTSMTLMTYNGSSHPMVYSNENNFRKVYKSLKLPRKEFWCSKMFSRILISEAYSEPGQTSKTKHFIIDV